MLLFGPDVQLPGDTDYMILPTLSHYKLRIAKFPGQRNVVSIH